MEKGVASVVLNSSSVCASPESSLSLSTDNAVLKVWNFGAGSDVRASPSFQRRGNGAAGHGVTGSRSHRFSAAQSEPTLRPVWLLPTVPFACWADQE